MTNDRVWGIHCSSEIQHTEMNEIFICTSKPKAYRDSIRNSEWVRSRRQSSDQCNIAVLKWIPRCALSPELRQKIMSWILEYPHSRRLTYLYKRIMLCFFSLESWQRLTCVFRIRESYLLIFAHNEEVELLLDLQNAACVSAPIESLWFWSLKDIP